jgi:D-cysteine desulfhydrase
MTGPHSVLPHAARPPAGIDRPLLAVVPQLRDRVPWCELGNLPTPVSDAQPVLAAAGLRGDVWIKRDDLTAPRYGGNKVRTLELLFGQARHQGAAWVYSTGAFGSNHAVATVLHAERAGLAPGALLFPQPYSETAAANLRTILGATARIVPLMHWATLPFAIRATARFHRRRGEQAFVMVPGGATPRGALGYVSAALELGHQIARGELPRPATIVVGVGSTCTSAGLLVGLHLAARLGIGFVDAQGRPAPPEVRSVRVTPWPVTAAFRIVGLAVRTSRHLAAVARDPGLALDAHSLRTTLRVDGRFLGAGYGRPTRAGEEAIACFRAIEGLELDTTYSAKAGAAVLELAKASVPGPILFWSTKSSAPLPGAEHPAAHVPARMERWLDHR